MKVTLRELREETRRVFGADAGVFERAFAGAWIVMVDFDNGRDVVEYSSYRSRMGARRIALACLRAMQPVDVDRA